MAERNYTFYNKQARLLGTCTGHKLMPGKNVLSLTSALYQMITSNEQFQNWMALGWVSVEQIPEVKEEANRRAKETLLKQQKAARKKAEAAQKAADAAPNVVDLSEAPLAGEFVPESKPSLEPANPEHPDPAKALEGLTIVEATEVIEACSDGDLLAVWYDADGRRGIKQVVEKRLKELGLLE